MTSPDAVAAAYYDIDANPHPVWRRLRDEAPLYRNDSLDFYALSRFDDVIAASSPSAKGRTSA